MKPIILGLLAIALSCSGSNSVSPKPEASAPRPGDAGTMRAPVPASTTPELAAAAAPDAHAAEGPAAKPTAAPAPEVAPPPAGGADFVAQGLELFRVAACGDGPLPARFDARQIKRHCAELQERIDQYRTRWVVPASAFIAKLRPADLPKVVVYPFGGGDLMSALATYPDALEFTTISLEPAGDVRKITTIAKGKLGEQLDLNRKNLTNLFSVAHSRTDNLGELSYGELPGQIVFTLAALVIHGYEPVALRYFRFNADGTLHYLSDDDIRDAEAALAKKSRHSVELTVFGNMELQFRKAGDISAPIKVLRHVAANLDNKHLTADPALLTHLEAKGKVAAMTKAASHLLWASDFSKIRDYLIAHMVWMISDSTGISVRIAEKSGFVQDTYGVFEGASEFGATNPTDSNDLKKLFLKNPKTPLPFRYYGYPDNAHHGHVVVTRPK